MAIDLSQSSIVPWLSGACAALAGLGLCFLAEVLIARLRQEEALAIAEITGQPPPSPSLDTPAQLIALAFAYRWLSALNLTCALICGLAAGLLVQYFGLRPMTGGLIIFALFLTVLALIDYRERLLPDVLVYPLIWLGLLAQLNLAFETVGTRLALLGAVTGYMVPWLSAQLFFRLSGREGLGHGDMKLLAATGAWLGPVAALLALFVGSILATIWQLAARRISPLCDSSYFAFGPWLALASLICVVTL